VSRRLDLRILRWEALGPLWWQCDTWKHRGRYMFGSYCLLLWFMRFSPVRREAFLCKARRFPILANDCLERFIPLLLERPGVPNCEFVLSWENVNQRLERSCHIRTFK
jgi:hypothetical protein